MHILLTTCAHHHYSISQQDGVNLCTFPEGTRSRSGRLMPFKNGAFKMAHKAGAPVVPMSICRAGKSALVLFL